MRRFAVLAVLAAVLSAAMAFAEVKDFGRFTLDIADGWTASQQGPTAIVVKNDNTSSMSVTYDAAKASAKDLAAAFAQEFTKTFVKVSEPEVDENGYYRWQMQGAQDVVTLARLVVEDGDYMLITMTSIETGGDDISAMLDSFKEK